MTEKTFVKVTNQEIYDRIERYHNDNSLEHNAIIQRLDLTNGKVKLSKWMATTALTVGLITVGYLISHISKG